MSGFVHSVCTHHRITFNQCPLSQHRYRYNLRNNETDNVDQELDQTCPEDIHHYTACISPSFAPLIVNNTVVAVCGYYVCHNYIVTFGEGIFDVFPPGVYSGRIITSRTWCNNRKDCLDGVDEKYCPKGKAFGCTNRYGYINTTFISTSELCDGKCNCLQYCEDEWWCGGYNYHHWYKCNETTIEIPPYYDIKRVPSYFVCDNHKDCYNGDDEISCEDLTTCVWEGHSNITYKLANNSRCVVLVMCANKLDHTNCTDPRLAPLMCPVGGYASTVSKYIICQQKVYTYLNRIHRNTSAVCDDDMDTQCVIPTPGCFIHKHQLCDDIIDCKNGPDEKSALCYRVTTQYCERKYNFNNSLKIPEGWVMDGIKDCVDGIDENITKWKSCHYPSFATYGVENNCEDLYICSSGYSCYVEVKSICDAMLSCQGGNDICDLEISGLAQLKYIPAKVENVNYLHYCLLGLEDLYGHISSCEHVTYPIFEIFGTQSNHLHLPTKQVSCKYVYGEQYVYLSCSGKCYDAICPLTTTPLASTTCSNILKQKTYSISAGGNLVFVKKRKTDFNVKNVFVCGNERCIHYSKVCNLINDCGDGTDEDNCVNHFVCNVKSNYSKSYILLSSVCDGKDDCLDSSDESSCCHRQLINGLVLKILSWLIGTLSLLLNGFAQTRSMYAIKRVRTSSALTNEALITLIHFGDWLVGSYLFSLAVIDVCFGSIFCFKQFDWLLSSSCSILGVVSTIG